jgi:hypothetical protein
MMEVTKRYRKNNMTGYFLKDKLELIFKMRTRKKDHSVDSNITKSYSDPKEA